jgi:glycosyltransferase involved in cell wall biosynthesis
VRVCVVARPGVGGVARVLEAMFRRLPERGVTGTAVLSGLEGTEMLDVAKKHGWDVVRVDMKREVSFVSDGLAFLKLRRRLRGHDIVHAHAAKAGGLVRIARPDAPIVYAPHGFYFTYHPEGSKEWNRYVALERRLAPGAKLVHCVSAAERDLAVTHGLVLDAEDAVVLPNPIPPRRADAPKTAPTETDERVVLMAARLAEPKDPLTFVRAAGLVDASLNARFLLVGEGPLLDEAKSEAAKLPDGRVVFVPARADVRTLLAGSRVAVLSSRSEAMPLFLLEALAEGVPAVATDLPGCREASGDAALYAPPGDAAALADAVARVLRDAALRRRLSKAATDRAPLFDEDRWLDGLVAMYGRAAAR